MATNKTNLFDKTLNGAYWDAGITFNRSNPVPIDKSSIYKTLEDAKTYASTSPVAYPGQIITVIAGEQEYSDWSFGELTGYTVTETDGKLYINNVEAKLSDNQLSLTAKVNNVDVTATRTVTKSLDVVPYQIIDSSGTLKKVGDNTATVELSNYLLSSDGIVDQLSSDISALSDELELIKDATLGDLTKLEESLSISLAEAEGSGDILKTYTLKQGTKDVGTINIPKDFLVKSAEVKTVTEDDLNEGGVLYGKDGFEVGDKYIDFVINAKDSADTSEHVYLNVKDLTDVYTGDSTANITVSVGANNKISAEFTEHFTQWIDSVNLSAQTLSDAIEALAGTTAENLAAAKTELSDYTDSKVADTLASAKSYSDTLSNAISSAAEAYTNEQIAALDFTDTLSELSIATYTSAYNDAKAYTDAEIDKLSTDLSVDSKIATAKSEAIADAKAYTDGKIEALSTDLSVDSKIVTALDTAKAYTDEQIAALDFTDTLSALSVATYTSAYNDSKAYTDREIEKLSTDLSVDSKIATALDEAKEYTDGKIEALSGSLSGTVDSKIAQINSSIGAVDTLVDSLSNEVSAISSDLTADINALEGRMTTAEGDIDALENIVNSTDLSALALATGDAQKVASKQYVQDQVASIGDVLHFKGVITVTEGQTVAEAVAAAGIYSDGESAVKGDIVLDSTNGTEYVFVEQYGDEANVWIEIGDENNHATKPALEAETIAREAADDYLSTAIDQKVYIGDYDGNVLTANSLSVVKISQADYQQLVIDKELDDNTVYIVSSDTEYNMYGQKIVGLAEGTELSDAVTYGQVSKLSDDIMAEVQANALSSVTVGDTAYTIDDKKNITLDISAICGGNADSE